MVCPLAKCCNERVSSLFFDLYCSSDNHKYATYCDVWKETTYPPKRPFFWANEKNISLRPKVNNDE